VNEEYGFTGAQALTRMWNRGPNSLIPRQPDVCVVTEPTMLDVVVAHRGIVRWRCHVHGRAAHSSQPDKGENAIYKMQGVIRAFQRYHEEVTPHLPRHPLCGSPTVCVSTIAGGVSVNTVPGSCTIELDRRLVPGEEPEEAYNAIVRYIAEQNPGVTGIEHEPPYRAIQGLPDVNNGPLAEALLNAAREVAPDSCKIGVPYGTDGSVISTTGLPTVVFGPGSIEQAHTADEWLAVEQLEQASEILYRFASRGL
jgi:acetylornithine deacetylase